MSEKRYITVESVCTGYQLREAVEKYADREDKN
jgi:hypothetical protein